ncbi:MAG: ribonuclease P protein component [Parvularculaceae bacterium]
MTLADPAAPSRSRSFSALKKRTDFLVAQAGLKAGAPTLLLARAAAPNGLAEARLGLTVTRKLGSAVDRNRIRRRLREAARLVFPEGAVVGYDYVAIARPAALTADFGALLDDMKRALLRLSAHPK